MRGRGAGRHWEKHEGGRVSVGCLRHCSVLNTEMVQEVEGMEFTTCRRLLMAGDLLLPIEGTEQR